MVDQYVRKCLFGLDVPAELEEAVAGLAPGLDVVRTLVQQRMKLGQGFLVVTRVHQMVNTLGEGVQSSGKGRGCVLTQTAGQGPEDVPPGEGAFGKK